MWQVDVFYERARRAGGKVLVESEGFQVEAANLQAAVQFAQAIIKNGLTVQDGAVHHVIPSRSIVSVDLVEIT